MSADLGDFLSSKITDVSVERGRILSKKTKETIGWFVRTTLENDSGDKVLVEAKFDTESDAKRCLEANLASIRRWGLDPIFSAEREN